MSDSPPDEEEEYSEFSCGEITEVRDEGDDEVDSLSDKDQSDIESIEEEDCSNDDDIGVVLDFEKNIYTKGRSIKGIGYVFDEEYEPLQKEDHILYISNEKL